MLAMLAPLQFFEKGYICLAVCTDSFSTGVFLSWLLWYNFYIQHNSGQPNLAEIFYSQGSNMDKLNSRVAYPRAERLILYLKETVSKH